MQKQASLPEYALATIQSWKLLLSFICEKKLPELLSTTQSAKDNWKQERVAHEINILLKTLPSTAKTTTREFFASFPDNCPSKLGLKVFLNSPGGKQLLM